MNALSFPELLWFIFASWAALTAVGCLAFVLMGCIAHVFHGPLQHVERWLTK